MSTKKEANKGLAQALNELQQHQGPAAIGPNGHLHAFQGTVEDVKKLIHTAAGVDYSNTGGNTSPAVPASVDVNNLTDRQKAHYGLLHQDDDKTVQQAPPLDFPHISDPQGQTILGPQQTLVTEAGEAQKPLIKAAEEQAKVDTANKSARTDAITELGRTNPEPGENLPKSKSDALKNVQKEAEKDEKKEANK